MTGMPIQLRPMPANQPLPQMGPWTTFHALAVSMGEPDVIVTGDYTLPHTVTKH